MARTVTVWTREMPIKPNTTEQFAYEWDTSDVQVDQNHTVVAVISYNNPYFGIQGMKGDIKFYYYDNVSYNYTGAFYVNPIKPDTKFFSDNIESSTFKNGTNVTIMPLLENYGWHNATVNITVTIFDSAGNAIETFYWIENVSERRHGPPKTTILEGQAFLPPSNQTYVAQTNVTYVNPDPDAGGRIVEVIYNKTFKVEEITVLTGIITKYSQPEEGAKLYMRGVRYYSKGGKKWELA
jgi:hypothetical protein